MEFGLSTFGEVVPQGGTGNATNANKRAKEYTDSLLSLIMSCKPLHYGISFRNRHDTDFLLSINKKVETIEDVILEQLSLDSAILDTSVKGLSIVPYVSDGINVGFENLFETDIYSLRNSIDLLEEDFDYIFLDIPGILSSAYRACLTASDFVFISLKGEIEEIENMHILINSIREIKHEHNTWLDLRGIILTMYNNQSSSASQIMINLKNNFGDLLYKTSIPKNNLYQLLGC
ncbi:MAG: ParA family protein, partial [Chitinophagaceae bacterium]